jgi:hypothetical protein
MSVEPYSAEPQSVEPYSAEPQSISLLKKERNYLRRQLRKVEKKLRKYHDSKSTAIQRSQEDAKLRSTAIQRSQEDAKLRSTAIQRSQEAPPNRRNVEIVLFKRGCECPCSYGSMGVLGFEQIQGCCKNPPTKKALLKMQRDDPKLVKLIRELFAHPDYKEGGELCWSFYIVTVETENHQKPLFKIVMDSDDIETLVLFNGKIVKEEFN